MIDNNNIEELIKQKLSNFETEVSANVWDKIDSQLDQLQPANNPGTGSDAILQTAGTNVTAWVAGIGAAVIGVITIGVLFFGETKEQSEIITDKTEVVTPPSEVNNNVTTSEIQSEDINGNDEIISKPVEVKSIIKPVAQVVKSKTSEAPIIEKVITEDADQFNRNKNLVVASDAESGVDEKLNDVVSGDADNTLSELNEVTNSLVDKVIYAKAPVVIEEAPALTEELIEQKIEEQETLNAQSSSIGQIPNVFTPNGDGINDHFLFATENIAELRVNIYNARGELVFVISGTDKRHWDGNLRTGQSAADGSYYYAVFATGFDGAKHQKKGTLYLNR